MIMPLLMTYVFNQDIIDHKDEGYNNRSVWDWTPYYRAMVRKYMRDLYYGKITYQLRLRENVFVNKWMMTQWKLIMD